VRAASAILASSAYSNERQERAIRLCWAISSGSAGSSSASVGVRMRA
jgi:hypothetical protein